MTATPLAGLDAAIKLITDCAEDATDKLRLKWNALDKAALRAPPAEATVLRQEQDEIAAAKRQIAKEAAAAIMQLPIMAAVLKDLGELSDELDAIKQTHDALTDALNKGASYLGKATELAAEIRKISGSKG